MRFSRLSLRRAVALAALLAVAAAAVSLLIVPLSLLGNDPGARRGEAGAGIQVRQPGGTADEAGTRRNVPASSRSREAAADGPGGGAFGRRTPRGAPRIRWRDSVALGRPEAGSLVRGVRFPVQGRVYFTWDPILKRRPNRGWRRWGTDDLVRTTLRVLRRFAAARPEAPRVGVGDLSRPHGGDFGPRFGSIGHATHQNGLDVDVYYPRLDRRERPPRSVDQIDLALAQDLVDRFVAAGAVRVYVGPGTGLSGPPGVVVPLVHHDNHLHARFG